MKKLLSLLVFLVFLTSSNTLLGQNLIPNPSFEICDNCNNQGAVEFGLGKSGSNNPPDWHAVTHGSSDIRSNEPRTGRRHGGFFAGTKYEYLSNHFESKLEPLATYQFSFFVKAGNTTSYWVDELGVYIDFKDMDYDIFTSLSRLKPQWTTPDGEFINNKGFEQKTFEYLACGGESHFVTGRFADLGPRDTMYSGQGRRGSVIAYIIVEDYMMEKTASFDFFQSDSLLFCGDSTITSPVIISDSLFDITVNGQSSPPEVIISGPGTYTFSATCKQSGETYVDTMVVYSESINFTLGPDTSLCGNEEIIIQGPDLEGFHLIWNNGDTSQSALYTGPGTVILNVSDGCIMGSDTLILEEKEISFDLDDLFPNAFTPNGDMINDDFKIKGEYLDAISHENFTIHIFNRWGKEVFTSNDPAFSWDGGSYISEVYLYTCSLNAKTCDGEEKFEIITKDLTLIK